MAKPRKGVVPPQLRKYLFKRRSGAKRSTMAKRRRTYTARARSVGRKVYRRARSVAGRAGLGLIEIAFSFGYGWARGKILNNSLVQQGMALLPVGGMYKENIFLGLGAYLIGLLFKPQGYFKLGLQTIIRSEAFVAGSKMGSGATLLASNDNSTVYN